MMLCELRSKRISHAKSGRASFFPVWLRNLLNTCGYYNSLADQPLHGNADMAEVIMLFETQMSWLLLCFLLAFGAQHVDDLGRDGFPAVDELLKGIYNRFSL